MKRKRVNLSWVFLLLLLPLIFSLIGISLPETINFINGFEKDAFYGNLASYAIAMVLFYFFISRTPITIERESYFVKLNNFISDRSEINKIKREKTTSRRIRR